MADKQSGTGAKGSGNKAHEGRGDEQIKNPVSAKNRAKQRKTSSKGPQGGDAGRGTND